MRSNKIASILGLDKAHQAKVKNIIKESIKDYTHRGLIDEETLLQVLSFQTKNLSKQEATFGSYLAGRVIESWWQNPEDFDIDQIFDLVLVP